MVVILDSIPLRFHNNLATNVVVSLKHDNITIASTCPKIISETIGVNFRINIFG